MRASFIFVLTLVLSCNTQPPTETASKPSSQVPTESEKAVVESMTTEAVADSSESIQSKENELLWRKVSADELPEGEKRISPSSSTPWLCAYSVLTSALSGETPKVNLPYQGRLLDFELVNSGTMSPALAKKFPNIRSYKGSSEDGKIRVRLDTNDEGLFVEFDDGSEKLFLSPLFKGDQTYYVSYRKEDLPNPGRDASFE